jgi:hypothetical protein
MRGDLVHPTGAIGRLHRPGARRRWAAIAVVAVGLAVALVAASSASGAGGPKNTEVPAITGTPQAGQTLNATTGVWTGSGLISYAEQWQRCDATGANCVELPFAHSLSLTLGSGDVNHTLRIVVTATDATGSAAVTSAVTAIVGPAPVGAPVNTAPPTISGTPNVGQAVTAAPGTWTGVATITYAFAWQRCDATGGNCTPIPEANAPSYTAVDKDAGGTLRVVVTATNPSGTGSATSVPTALLPGSPNGITTLPGGGKSVAVADIALPNQLAIAKVTFTPSSLSNRNPFTLKVRIEDLRHYAVNGALVYALGVPYSRIATVPEVPTKADGTVVLTLHPLPGLSLGRGQYLVIFLRARKPNDPINGGVSVRQLIQLRTGPPA